MDFVEKHSTVVVDENAVLNDEIMYLVTSPEVNRSSLDIDDLDPLSGSDCFIGQLFLGNREFPSWKYRKAVGCLPKSDKSKYHTGDMTALEIFSAIQWEKGNKEAVLSIARLIKAGLPKFSFDTINATSGNQY